MQIFIVKGFDRFSESFEFVFDSKADFDGFCRDVRAENLIDITDIEERTTVSREKAHELLAETPSTN